MKQLLFIGLSLLFISCNETENIKEYYYQLENFDEPKYYVFEYIGNPEGSQYWKIKTNKEKKELTTEVFNSKFEKAEFSKEKFDESGAKFIEYSSFSNGRKTESKINSNNVFLWEPHEEYNYSMTLYEDGIETEFKKVREYIGKETILVLGKKTEAIKFKGSYTFDNSFYKEPVKFWQYSYYTKDHAFVKWERHSPNGEIMIMELKEILTENEWNNLK
ncbi:hypothetical protein K6119_04155 [Paracrocinitomix mangrovi]|uniref:hypothetical protein n=1 Tax=Paracrocinitomix mangrovi TaxID=2862509 RepID=UPI001C8D16B7|nr:hypothetical protein [Paracrocinitomix mangrovi]UKN02706.1 hypothetical protein K6119_04155 [Paracrocinitomix mangrovi]